MACVAGGGKVSLGGTPEHRLSVCSCECPQLSVVFLWGRVSWAPGIAGKGQMRPRCPRARGPDRTWQGPRPELGLDLCSLTWDVSQKEQVTGTGVSGVARVAWSGSGVLVNWVT